ncbi:MAG: cobalamin biosynthesis protein CobD [Nitrospira bacterium HGW-Nitrospira-1]|nr:MAG: cobalamin biosynthesis protein CobD [Nitrospira bacterium HGW-Nitrospira-1]
MIGPIDLVFAFFLDLAIGDPRWLPHPVRVIGRAVTRLENFLVRHVREESKRIAGIFLVAGIVLPVAVITFLFHRLILWSSANLSVIVSRVFLVYLISTTIAVRGLIDAARLVIKSVHDGRLEAARKKLSMLVGRDTAKLSGDRALAAVIETLAENLSDGIIAPVFYLVIGGLPLAMAYKAVNTLDSMVGYKNEKYIRLGWAAARLDDIANYIPARITGFLIVIATGILGIWYLVFGKEKATPPPLIPNPMLSLKIMRRDGRNHSSPNSGIPEAAIAGALGVRLGGPSTYGGTVVEKPHIGDSLTNDYLIASRQAAAIVFISSVLAVMAAAVILGVRTMP